MEFVSAILGPVVNVLMAHITKKLGYLTSSTEHVKRMKNRMQYLESQSAAIEGHMKENELNNREIPQPAQVWLKDLKKTKEDIDNISSNDIGCFNIKKKYLAGRNALRHIKDIERLIEASKDIIWRDAQIPLGRVDSKSPASTSASGGNTQNVFNSRVKTFNDALKLLQQADDDKTRVIALCGMGGVGKTTLMKQLKEAARDNKMFNWIVDVGIGKTPNLLAIQKAIAERTGKPLTETGEMLMASKLSKRFEVFSQRKERSLVILDDVWKESKIKLEDIGLGSSLPNGVKLLLTSRDENICQQIAIDADSVLEVVRVDVLEEGEARDLFSRIAGISEKHNRDLYHIGCDIVKKCGCLPLAIKLIAATLKCQREFVWRHTLDRLKLNDLDESVQEIIEISYKSLKHEDKAIFLLCGLFPEDYNIPIEDLTRYAWGLKLLKQVSTIGNARDSTQTSVSNLKNAYLLMDGDSDHNECVKMHDLVLAFVVSIVSKSDEDGCWIIYPDDFSNWSEDVNMSQSCKRISLACNGMSEFPGNFKFPNLSLLKLVHGNESLRFPLDFYEGMKKLQVIVFEKLEYPVVPTSFQCSTNLRNLCLHECSLMFDLTCIGNLSNLEVLSFANSSITILPSTFGKLKKLRLLDVTGCYNLVIDDGVLKGLVKLEELYMRSLYMRSLGEHALCFTDNNSTELAERSENLCALEFEFIDKNASMKNMFYEKLKRFKLSLGCYFSEVRDKLHTSKVDTHSYLNSLKLITNREELFNSKISELFKNTDALYLKVNGMNTLEDVDVESPHPARGYSSFYNLRLLVVSKCTELKYLFTPSVAKNLSNLEYLDISRCPIMEAVIHTGDNGSNIIKFPNLKYLRLDRLPNLLCFSNNDYVIQLPRLVELKLEGLQSFTNIFPSGASSSASSNISRVQSFFHEEDATPKLQNLLVSDMENLKEIWPPQFSISKLCQLRELTVEGCGSIVVLFSMDFGEFEHLSSSLRSITVGRCDSLNLKEIWPPQFSISKLCQLRELTVEGCGSIVVLFSMDFGEFEHLSSSLRSITVGRCDSLVKLFSYNPFPFMNNLQELKVERCGSIQVLFNADLGRAGKSEEQVCSSSLRRIEVEHCDSLVNLLPRNPMPLFNHLEELKVEYCASIEVIFDIDIGCVGEMDKVSSSRLRRIHLWGLGKLREVWKIKDAGNNLIHGFEAVESIYIRSCERFEKLITPTTTNLDMRALKEVKIFGCGGESDKKNELVESNQDQEPDRLFALNFDARVGGVTSDPNLVIVVLAPVKRPLKLGKNGVLTSKARLMLYLYLGKNQMMIYLKWHSHSIYCTLSITFVNFLCATTKAVEVVFEIQSPSTREPAHNTQQPLILPYLEELELKELERMSHVWKCNWNEFLTLQKQQSQCSFHNLTTIEMEECHKLKYLFSPLMAKLLSNLKEIYIQSCDGIEEVVSNRDDEDGSYIPTQPPLSSLI
ncbi:NB-ARC domains-containing protein [Artemisia annua]|uniref:NB-ARC domains-containing protein n=1 Tax=Artemisia annua TaxID=35608 RepID=A0A2U1PS84_ARTAN|nr:NB-ARC domains-containing protein [Artemisia annua]